MQAAIEKRIESILSARLFLAPQLGGDWLFFVSNLSGHLSLYRMQLGGSVPEPLIPPHIALQNPHHMPYLYRVLPHHDQILLMLDNDGDENYQPMLLPVEGGYPRPAFGDQLAGYRCHLTHLDEEHGLAYFFAESRTEPMNISFKGDLLAGTLEEFYRSQWGGFISDVMPDGRATIVEGYTAGDHTLYLRLPDGEVDVLYGTPLDERADDYSEPLNSIGDALFTKSGKGLVCFTSLFADTYGVGHLSLDAPGEAVAVTVDGLRHTGDGEFEHIEHLRDGLYALLYNIDGCSWLYEAGFDEGARRLHVLNVLCGEGELSNGMLESFSYDREGDRFALSYSTATSPTQLYTISAGSRELERHTSERLLGLHNEVLAPGEDASFISHDGTRISARLYLPAPELGYGGKRPLVYYVHGGPQAQERPDFTWFSMPLIQFLTLNGFAVFVPNARGSTGFGLGYMKQVDRDWGGKDRLDHVAAMEFLAQDERIDTSRAGVTGRSFGGFMTLTLASRHPELWQAAIDMFGPYDLLTFIDRLPETWKPYFALSVGDPEKDRDFLIERSPRTYIGQIECPLMVIQGKNDPRVIEQESRDVVEQLQAMGKEVEYLMFPDEGHDVLKYNNRVTCYTAMTDFFRKHLADDGD